MGSEQMKQRMLEMMGSAMGRDHGGEEKHETDKQKAERLLMKELQKRGWAEQDWEPRRKTGAVKVKLAAGMRAESLTTLDRIAQRLRMGRRHTVADCLKR